MFLKPSSIGEKLDKDRSFCGINPGPQYHESDNPIKQHGRQLHPMIETKPCPASGAIMKLVFK